MQKEESTKIGAEVSVSYCSAYIGVKVRDALKVGYNDKIRVTFPNAGPSDSDVTVKKCLDSSNQITIGAELSRAIANNPEFSGVNRTQHVDAIVEKVNERWEDGKKPTEKRWKKVKHLAAEIL